MKPKSLFESSEKVPDFILRASREDKIPFVSRLACARSKDKKVFFQRCLFIIIVSVLAFFVSFSSFGWDGPFSSGPPGYRHELGRTIPIPSLSEAPPGGPSRAETGILPPEDYSCDGAPTIDLSRIIDVAGLQRYLDNSFSPEYLVRDAYRLCFIDTLREARSGVTFNRTAGYGTTPVLISGLKINIASDAPIATVPLTIGGSSVALDQGEFHGSGNAAGVIVNGDFVRLHTLTIDGFNNGIEVNSNFVITEGAIVHGSGRIGSGIILRGNFDSIISSAIDNFNKGVEIWGEDDFLGPDTFVPAELVEIRDNNIGIDVHQKARFTYIKNYGNRTTNANFDPALGLTKPIVVPNDERNEGKALFARLKSDGSMEYWLQFADAPEGAKVTIYKRIDGSYFGECTILPEGNCFLSVSEDVRKGDFEYWSLVDDPLFTMPFPDPFEFGDPTPIPVTIGVGPEIPVPSPPSGVSSSSPVGVENSEEGTAESGGSQMTGSAVKSSGPGGCGGGGGATIVPPNLPHLTSPYKGEGFMILWWLIFAAPAVLVAVRIKKRR